MGLMKDAGNSFLKYSELLVNKTEEYARIGKLTLDIKRMERNISQVLRELGEYVVGQYREGSQTVLSSDQTIADKTRSLQEFQACIDSKKKEIEELKKGSGTQGKTPPESGQNTGTQEPL